MSQFSTVFNSSFIVRLFNKTVLAAPTVVLVLIAAGAAFFGYYVKDFRLDASPDSIILENDEDLRYYDITREVFGSDDYVIVTLTVPEGGDLFSDDSLARLESMTDEFAAMPHVGSVTSILNVPLFHSPDVPMMEIATGYKTLLAPGADRELARDELIGSPLYQDYLISRDGTTTGIQVTFEDAPEDFQKLDSRKTELRDKKKADGLSKEESQEFAQVESAYADRYAELTRERIEDIDTIRGIVASYEDMGELHIGGVPMIMADIIDYVGGDIKVFGVAVLVLVLIMLFVLFREVKWIVLPTITCILAVLVMMGYLGYSDWSTTFVTSNFPSLLLVITLAMTIHIVVRYREIYAGNPEMSNRDLILNTVRLVARPCLYTSLTTMVGFGSLIVSGIRPVMDFGLIMAAGLGVAYFLCFVFMPAALMFFPRGKVPPAKLAQLEESPLSVFARFTERHGIVVAVISVLVFVVFAAGATRIQVENRFIDYFREHTEIYQGMTVIDERLGGTTPLEVVLEGEGKDYWLETEHQATLREIHQWFDDLPETGKVISADTMIRIMERVNKGKPVPKLLVQIALASIPKTIQDAVVTPYLSPDRDQVRIAMRVRESSKDLRRKELMEKITTYLESNEDIPPGTAHVTGVFVLYNNLLQSLFESQIKTLGTVYTVIWLMFFILFRSWRLATIATIPNLLPVILILGTLGWANIPLDIMTITTAAITLGIAVDFAIHYIHRFQAEFPRDRSYIAAMYRCHNSIGRAIYYTSLTIVVGFSVLSTSNFIPTVYFGMFTALAITVALLASITLLPLLLITWKPLGPETPAAVDDVAPEDVIAPEDVMEVPPAEIDMEDPAP